MILKRLVAIGLVGIMTLSLMACSAAGPSNSKAKEKLVIWSWGADEEKKSREAMVEAFKEAHPEIEVEHSVIPTADHVWDQKMTAALSAGTGPDVIQMSPDYYGLYTDYYEDLNPYVEKEDVDLPSVITEGMIAPYYRPDGKLEAMPLLQNVFVLAYNKDMFDQFGVDYPTADWTWDDLAEAAKKFAGGEGANATFGIVNHWISSAMSIIVKGGSAYSDDLKTCEINSQEVRDGLTLFGDLIQSGAMPDDTSAKGLPKEQLFVSGHAAMYPLGGFEAKLIADEVGENFQWDAVPMPKVSNNGKNNLMYATGYAMVKDAKNKETAWTFIKEAAYANENMAKATATIGLPSNKSVSESYYKDLKYGPISNGTYLDSLANAKLNIWGGTLSAPGDVWRQIWESVTIDGKTPDEAMDEYYLALEKAFNETNKNND